MSSVNASALNSDPFATGSVFDSIPFARLSDIYGSSARSSPQSVISITSFSKRSAVNSSPISRGSVIDSGSIISAQSSITIDIHNINDAPPNASGSVYLSDSREIPTLPIEMHKLNIDPNPIVIKKKSNKKINYTQNISLRLLKPPAAPEAGDIIITQEPDVQLPAAPPLIVRQEPTRSPVNLTPIVFREKPPQQPSSLPSKHIVIPGKIKSPPPRKVIVERLPAVPSKPQDIVIEKWLSYPKRVRNVVFNPAVPVQKLASSEKNLLIEWESPEVNIEQIFNFLGIEEEDPMTYMSRHGSSLVDSSRMPKEAARFEIPVGHSLASESILNQTPILRGNVEALRRINLSCYDLNEYASQI